MSNERAIAEILSTITAIKQQLAKGHVDSAVVYIEVATKKLNTLKQQLEETDD